MARRPFGHVEDDGPPDMTFVEARDIRTWIQRTGPAHEIKVITSRKGGVTRVLELIHQDIGGGFVRGRRDEWLATVVDLSQATHLASLLIGLRNAVVRGSDDLLGPTNHREHGFLAFDIALLFWWRRMRPGAPIQPPLEKSDLNRFLRLSARIGIGGAISGLAGLLGPIADAIANSPLGEAAGEKLSQFALSLAGKALHGAAGGLLIKELRKGRKADPSIVLAALPDLFLAGLKVALVNPATGIRRRSRSGKLIRHLMIVDAADELDSTLPFAPHNVDVLANLITEVAKLDDSRVLVGARDPIRRIENKLSHPLAYQTLAPFARPNLVARLGKTPGAEALIDSMIAALCPDDHDDAAAWPLHLVWARRFDLPDPPLARDLSLLARRLGPGVKSESDLIAAADGEFGPTRTPDLLSELNRKPYVWIWSEGPGRWHVNPP